MRKDAFQKEMWARKLVNDIIANFLSPITVIFSLHTSSPSVIFKH
jgi:hypothetical protein